MMREKLNYIQINKKNRKSRVIDIVLAIIDILWTSQTLWIIKNYSTISSEKKVR